MRRALAVVFTVAALAAAFAIGQDRGITLGIEEYSKFHPIVVPVPCPAPSPFGFSS